jgi:cobyrinic acid a,c-diamide synthase
VSIQSPVISGVARIVIAGAASSVGKTTVTTAIIALLRQRGLKVQPFKCGPDYIDPSYHERAAGRPCRNLDAWMLDDAQLVQGFERACRDADIAVIEGVMGLFDGCEWTHERGSTAQVAKLLNAPVLLVVDISGAARSAAISVLGSKQFDPQLALRAAIVNFAGSERHARGCSDAITRHAQVPVLGWLPRADGLQIPQRHLGLVPGGEKRDADELITRIRAAAEDRFDLQAIIELAQSAGDATDGAGIADIAAAPTASAVLRGGVRPILAVARDEAFCFYYPENIELLVDAGAQIEFFSPLRGESPHRDAAGVYLGGGYPELHASALSANTGLWEALKDLQSRDAPIYAECGGFMVLTEGLIDRDGHTWPMAGLLPGVTRMNDKLAALGYRHARALRAHLLSDEGESLRGHEFHYSSWTIEHSQLEPTAAWHVRATRNADSGQPMGYAAGNLLASYLHLHFGQRPQIAARFVQRLKQPREVAELRSMRQA